MLNNANSVSFGDTDARSGGTRVGIELDAPTGE